MVSDAHPKRLAMTGFFRAPHRDRRPYHPLVDPALRPSPKAVIQGTVETIGERRRNR